MPADHEADELDRLIESRLNGESPAAPNPLSDALADLAGQLDGLAHQAELPDSADVWSRVADGIEAHEQAQRPSLLERWWPSPSTRAFWAPTLAASLALFAVLALLISEPDSTSAAFVEDVERLSAVTSDALADDVLTPDERESVTALAAALAATVDRRPHTIAELSTRERADVLEALDQVLIILVPVADAELTETRSNTLLAAAGLSATVDADRSTAGAAGVPPGPLPPALVDQAAPPNIGQSDPPLAVPAATPSVALSVASLEGVTDAVENDRRGSGLPSSASGRESGAGRAAADDDDDDHDDDDQASVCFGLTGSTRTVCERAVMAAVAACGGAIDSGDLDECERATEFAEDVCEDLLPKRDARTCERALERLSKAAERHAESLSEDRRSSLDHESIGPSDQDRDDREDSDEHSDED